MTTTTVAVETVIPGMALEFRARWQDSMRRQGPVSEHVPVEEFLDETHHRAYGRPWCIGRDYFRFLRDIGLRPEHRVLDFGCGAGRLGVWLIGYLAPGHYFGIDADARSLLAFASYEIPLHDLADKRPRLLWDDSFAIGHFATRFDLVTDLFVTKHLGAAMARHAYAAIVAQLAPGGRIVLPHPPLLDTVELAGLGLRPVAVARRPLPLLAGTRYDAVAEDHWHVLAHE